MYVSNREWCDLSTLFTKFFKENKVAKVSLTGLELKKLISETCKPYANLNFQAGNFKYDIVYNSKDQLDTVKSKFLLNGKKIIDLVNKWDFKWASDVMATSWIGTTNAKTWEVMQSLVKRRKEAANLLVTPTISWTQYSDQQINELAYLTELQEKNPSQAAKDMKELWLTPTDIANYKAWNMPLTEKQKQSSINVMEDIKDLVTNYDWNDATWVHFGMPVIAWTDRADTLQKIWQIVAKMTLPNLWSLKWPMSDKDLDFITKASSNLSEKLSDKQFEKNLIIAYNLAARRAWMPEITDIKEIKSSSNSKTATPVKKGISNADIMKAYWK